MSQYLHWNTNRSIAILLYYVMPWTLWGVGGIYQGTGAIMRWVLSLSYWSPHQYIAITRVPKTRSLLDKNHDALIFWKIWQKKKEKKKKTKNYIHICWFIIWQAPQAVETNQIPRLDWLPERAVPSRDCPFCSRNNISPNSKHVHESVLSQDVFCDCKKILRDFSFGMELELNEKTETSHHFNIEKTQNENLARQ